MNKSFLTLFLLACFVFAVGCKDDAAKSSAAGSVAIIDPDRIFKASGWSEDIRKNLQQTKDQIGQQLEKQLLPSRQSYEKKRDAIAAALKLTPAQIEEMKNVKQPSDLEKLNLSKDQIGELTQAATLYAAESGAAQARLSQTLQSHQQALLHAYLQAIEPAIRRVATANNRAIVFMSGPTLLYNDADADLTDKVIDDLQHSVQVKVDLPPMPKLEFAPTTAPTTKPG